MRITDWHRRRRRLTYCRHEAELSQIVTMGGVIVAAVLGLLSYRRAGKAVTKVEAVDSRVQNVELQINGRLTQLLKVVTQAENAKGVLSGTAIGIAQEKTRAEEIAVAKAETPS
jgi:hypothetical protein